MSNLFGIYYEQEGNAYAPDSQQAVIGVMVEEIEHCKISLLMEKFPGKYKESKLAATMCVGTKYPYFNSASLIMIVSRVYPRLAEFVKQKRLSVGPGIVEIYKLLHRSPHVEILAPLENMAQFLLP